MAYIHDVVKDWSSSNLVSFARSFDFVTHEYKDYDGLEFEIAPGLTEICCTHCRSVVGPWMPGLGTYQCVHCFEFTRYGW